MEPCLVDNFEKVCRICMKFDKTFLSITSFQIIDMIMAFASVQIWENDDLPNQICHACFLQLQNTFSFKQLCENSDNKFRQIIQQNKINLPNTPNDFHHVKDEKFEDYVGDNSPIDIKEEEDIFENTHENALGNGKISLDNNKDDSKKSETNDILEIKNEDRELNKLQSTKSEKGSDTCEDENVVVFTCEKCNKEYKKVWALGQHMHRKHRAKVLKCNKCELKFYHPLHLKEHQESTHNPSNLTCNTCNKVYTNIYDLKRHKFEHLSLHCQQCDKLFKDRSSFKKHNRAVHPRDKYVTCHICGISITKKALDRHLETHKEHREKLTCDICSKELTSLPSLQNHVTQVHGDPTIVRKHLCNICGYSACKLSNLQRHLLIHSTERPYACDRCDKTYGRPDYLKQHISHVHLNIRKFQCKFCSQTFPERRTLVHHERRHTGEKPHKCEECGKAFAQKIAMRTHMKTHRNPKKNFMQNLDGNIVTSLIITD
ncbi:zinc finger protein 883-like [Chrysoperla carnea]|uniref:zinc finger protein 883-like n=1 Tax=Chrysoperla carnea TaxID=189513 RepID=UPI001D07A7E9|nr:zinc finger protein 883-like [Chrysoperla carnea]